ncbi:galactonate oxidoreductase [Yersinia enterocolitica]|nr:galactonate oxidoreductase [Yersinia enterocolitica]EKN5963849.1 galactonate oxidoreductase [Yersinia enterocolitica]EKN6096995.1 galactonate oxidoreductase [Yersinia enterocolitica]EKN6132247.1 galactonate oxidoreductase [Yersinia enterocolitica]EKN6142247.1 galactonate oxidoreductase [Yersinia enterocolitica]
MENINTMKILLCEEPTKLVYQQRALPIPKADEALIKVLNVGICGTDIHAWAGQQPFFSYPRVLGHEICGEIIELGDNVHNMHVGQRVAVIPYVACHHCNSCLSGKTNCCENISVIGVHQDGGFSEYLSVPTSNLLLVDDVDPVSAALIEPFAISAHAVRRADIHPGEHVLVVGAGPIGLGVAAIAQADGAHVVMADTSTQRRNHVENLLDICALDPSDAEFEQQLRQQFSGMLPLKVIDATGNQRAMNNTVNFIRHGGSIVFVGLFKGDLSFPDPDFHKKETTMMGSRNATFEDFAKVGKLMAAGKLSANMILTHSFEFNTLADVYEQQVVKNKDLIKGVIRF